MRPWRHSTADDDGSAALEFITVGLILLIPLVYLIVALGVIQDQTLGVEAAARHTARAISQAPDEATAEIRAERVLTSVAEEYGIDRSDLSATTSCIPAEAECPAPGALVAVTISARVRLPLMPSVLGLDRTAAVPVEATAVQRLPLTWGAGE